jgi:hypothetical protein
MKEISSMDFSQHGVVFYFYSQALCIINTCDSHKTILIKPGLPVDGDPRYDDGSKSLPHERVPGSPHHVPRTPVFLE